MCRSLFSPLNYGDEKDYFRFLVPSFFGTPFLGNTKRCSHSVVLTAYNDRKSRWLVPISSELWTALATYAKCFDLGISGIPDCDRNDLSSGTQPGDDWIYRTGDCHSRADLFDSVDEIKGANRYAVSWDSAGVET